ncbi:MAG: hypothetical protein GY903_21010 [Fuerstiella sp.]|nr:hypothetical protein [Fuerstiella sp.]
MNSHTTTAMTQLSDRDHRIIAHVARHRVSTNEVVHKLFFSGQQPNAVTKVTARLYRSGHLRKFPLYHPRFYFRLGLQSIQMLVVSEHRMRPLGPQSLPIEFGTLAYATMGERYHRRLTPQELRHSCGWMDERLLTLPHCLDETGATPVQELVRIDLGGRADHVARKCVSDIQFRSRHDEFRQIVYEKLVRLVVVTGTTEKAAAIGDSLEGHVWPDGLAVHMAVVPDLLQLTGP